MALSSLDETAGEPLASLYEAVERAGELEWVDAPRADSANPVETIRSWSVDEAGQIGAREEPLAYREPAAAGPSPDPGSIEAVVGREVLAMLAEKPLPAEARARAARLLAAALDNPSRDALRRVLRVILGG